MFFLSIGLINHVVYSPFQILSIIKFKHNNLYNQVVLSTLKFSEVQIILNVF